MSTHAVPSGSPARERGSRWRFLLGATAVVIGIVASTLTTGPTATAASAAAAAQPPSSDRQTVSAESLPTPQVDGVVWEQLVVGDTVYVAGAFSSARPFKAKPGVGENPRSNFLAYDLETGALLPFAPTFNSTVYTIAASPDGKRLYAGGIFTDVNGQARYRMAAFDLPSGELVAGFRPIVNQKVQSLVATNDALYVGGTFTSAGQRTGTTAVARANAAAFAAADASVLRWAPQVQEGRVLDMVMSPAQDKIILGGTFRSLNGSSAPGWTMGAVDTIEGASLPWKINSIVPDQKDFAAKAYDYAVYGLSADDEYVYGSMGPASFEGTWQAKWSDGSMGWLQDCHGDSYGSYSDGSVVYTASHAHDCSNIGGFTDYAQPNGWYRALAVTREATQKVGWWDDGYRDYSGQPAPTVLNWYPQFDTGPQTGQGPWHITGAKGYVLVGGEFTTLNGTGQQGLARFAPRSAAPNTVGPSLSGEEMKPWVTSVGASGALVKWGLNFDRDDETLTYQVLRDGVVVHELNHDSSFWMWRGPGEKTGGRLPKPGERIETVSWTDVGLEPGRSYTYQIRTLDPDGNAAIGTETSVTKAVTTVETGLRTAYDRRVLDDQPVIYWPFNEANRTTAGYDWAGTTAIGSIAERADGVEPDAHGLSYNLPAGKNGYAAAVSATTAMNTYSSEVWFNTTTKTGGQLIGMAADRQPTSAFDRQVYMDNAGRIWSANYDTKTTTNGTGLKSIGTRGAYNDGKWHHVVNTLGPDGLKLYVDGVLQASRADTFFAYSYGGGKAYWNVGGHALTGRPSAPTSMYFSGRIDNVGIYSRVLDAATVTAHYTAASQARAGSAPTAAFTSTTADQAVAVDASTSTDTDGTVTSFVWDFGDGASGTGETASHAYAAPGVYTIRLTVTDNSGYAHTTSSSVRIAPASATAYDRMVIDDKPSIYWSFNEQSGNAIDVMGTTDIAVISARTDGFEADARGRSYDLSSTWSAAVQATSPLNTYSSEAWFNTTTKTGGQLIGMAAARDTKSAFDRQVYMDNAGRIWSANYDGALKAVSSSASYNDGKWHHVVNTLGPTGLRLYVDGVLVASRTDTTTAYSYGGAKAYWNLGGHALTGRPNAPSSITFTGKLDNVGIYPRVLDATTVKEHHQEGAAGTNVAPKASFTHATDALVVEVDASTSTDVDGSISSYAWDFGDGSTGSGRSTSHTYTKTGTYTVKLTVTDGAGSSHSTTASVSVSATESLAEDGFDRTTTAGWGAPDVGGAWALVGSAASFATDGASGVMKVDAGATRSATVGGVSALSTSSSATFTIAEKPTGSQYVSVIGRKVGADAYTARVVVQASGVLQLQVQKSGTTVKAVNLTGVTYTPGQPVSVRFDVSGSGTTTLSAKAWTTGAEPTDWQATATDTTAVLQGPGTVGLGVYIGSGGAQSTVSFDDYAVTALD